MVESRGTKLGRLSSPWGPTYTVYLALLVGLTVLALIPATRSAATIALGAATVVAAAAAVRGFGREHLWAGLLLLGTMLAQLVGLIAFVRGGGVTEPLGTFPTAGDDWFLAALPLLIAGLALLAVPGTERRWSAILDPCIVAVALAVVLWLALFDSVHPIWPSWQPRVIAFAYMLGYVAVLALSVMIGGSDRRRLRVGLLLVIGTVALVFASFLVLPHPTSTPAAEDGVYTGFALSRLAWSAAVLDPAILPRDPAERRPTLTPRAWSVLMTIAALVGPIILIVQDVRGQLNGGPGQTAVALVLFAAVAIRLAVAMWEGLRATATERTLRRTGTLLLTARSLDAVAASLSRAGTELTASLLKTEVVLLLDHRSDQPRARYPADDIGNWRTVVTYPLVTGVAGDERTVGTLIAASNRTSLSALDGPLRILADQTALALDRLESQRELRGAGEGGVLPHPRAEHFRRDLHRRGRRDDPLRQPVRGARVRAECHSGRAPGRAGRRGSRGHRARSAGQPARGAARHPLATAHGSVLDSETRCADLRHEPTVGALAITVHDVTEQRRLLARLRSLAHEDPLSGLANRRRFLEAVDQALAPQPGGGPPVAVMMLDVDDFKQVNDTLGHAAGDELIQQIGHRLAASVRTEDTVARLGGDEFAVLVTTAHSVAELDHLADRIVTSFGEPVTLGSGPLAVSVSVGLAVVSAPFRTHELLRQADLALYAAKDAGKRQWRRHGA